jgi:hypothetical protein
VVTTSKVDERVGDVSSGDFVDLTTYQPLVSQLMLVHQPAVGAAGETIDYRAIP